jgi:NADH-quinone oxidoreductase subunit M
VRLLTALTFAPAVAGLVLTGVKSDRAVRATALAVTVLVFVLGCAAWASFDPARGAAMQLTESDDWVSFGTVRIRYALGVDGLALPMVLLTALLMPLAVRSAWHMPRGFMIALLFLETGMMGAFVATDLFLFYVFWEAMLVPMALLIGIWGGPRRVYAAVKFFVYTLAGSLLMLAAILYCYAQAGSFDVVLLQDELPRRLQGALRVQQVLFLGFALSFAVKVPMFPFHTWLPDAHVEAPTAGSVILAGVLLKLGVYGFLRFAIPFFPEAARHFAPAIVALAAIGVVYGAAMAMAQSDMKKLVAYSSVSHLGYCMLGVFSGTLAGAQGGVLQMVNHGLSTGGLFLLVGLLYERTHRRGVDDFGGMAKVTPKYAAVFMLVTLSSIGLPGLNGFVGEFLVLFGSFGNYPVATAISATGVVLGAVYMLGLYRDVFWGPVTLPEREKTADLSKSELAMLAPVLALCVLLGVWPNSVLKVSEPAVDRVVRLLSPERHAADRPR